MAPNAVAHYLEQARHADWQQRREAGVVLADNADNPLVAATLLVLLLDAEDTAVTAAVTTALLKLDTRTGRDIGLQLIVSAFVTADANTADWLYSSLYEHLNTVGNWVSTAERLRALARAAQTETALAARELLTDLDRDMPKGSDSERPS